MKSILRFLGLTLSAAFACVIVLNSSVATKATAHGADFDRTFLLAGFDDSSWHTDVISLVKYNHPLNLITVIQIPRDTYYNFGGFQNKINQFTATAVASGSSPNEAMSGLVKCINEQFAINIDGFVALTTEAFESIINNVGEIVINCEKEYILRGRSGETVLSFARGENTLQPSQAILFVRHRYGYLRGDLDRLDAQKVFFVGLFKSLLSESNPISLVWSLLKTGGVYTDLSFSDILSLSGVISDARSAEIETITIPGEAKASSTGIWYYVLNRGATVEMLASYYGVTEDSFDKKRLFDYLGKR